MIRPIDIASRRLSNQLITNSSVHESKDVIKHMIAIQAQDYLSSLSAIGIRCASEHTETTIEASVSKGSIVRTWPMRGTLHFVAAEDVRWLLRLLTPRVIQSFKTRYRELGLSSKIFTRSINLFEKALQGGKQLTRSGMYQVLEDHGIKTDQQRGYHILAYCAQKEIICWGPRHGKQHTFVLLDDWIHQSKELEGEEALAELAARYIQSRGPVSEYDFSFWSGLTVTDARNAFRLVEDQFEKEKTESHTYWYPDHSTEAPSLSETPVILPAFDEMICGYKDRSAILDSDHEKSAILRNGIIRGMILLNGKTAGTWRRTLKKKHVVIETEFFHEITDFQREQIIGTFKRYGDFIGLKAEFSF